MRNAIALLAALAFPAAITAQAPTPASMTEPTVEIALSADVENPATTFEGWGTALAWFANVTGGWPERDRNRLADLLYGPDGLGWTIARYNIGGGAAPGAKPLSQPGANIAGFWRNPNGAAGRDWWRADDPAMWDWSRDRNQRWWLDAIRARVPEPIFEAFSNSPPWFMTISGEVSGARDANSDNLRPGYEGRFADYLAITTRELQRRHRIRFRTLSPVNEPLTDYWYAGNRQEGAHWSVGRQAAMIDATHAALRRHAADTVVSAPDETSSHLFLRDWAAYPAATRARIGQLNVHSYGNVHQTAVRDIARSSGIRLWMSENDTPLSKDPEQFDGMNSALAFAEHVVGDLKRLEPAAWIFWQAVENISGGSAGGGSNWGLLKTDLRAPAQGPHTVHVTRKYWAMAHFSRYIRPGYRLIRVDDHDSVAALSPDGGTLAIVHVNGGISPRRLMLPQGWGGSMVVTNADRVVSCAPGATVPPRSIASFTLTRGGSPGERACHDRTPKRAAAHK